jgi:hypothetical protein
MKECFEFHFLPFIPNHINKVCIHYIYTGLCTYTQGSKDGGYEIDEIENFNGGFEQRTTLNYGHFCLDTGVSVVGRDYCTWNSSFFKQGLESAFVSAP